MGRGFWDFRYEPRPAIPVKDGVKARSQRGRIGETWWSARWLAVLESLGMGARLDRGKAYARRGQVISLDIGQGIVSAKVQGTRPKPYKVTASLPLISDQEWDKVIDAMAAKAIFAAKLLAGEMPQDIEEAFRTARVPLFPARRNELQTDCSCPDWANPCKHIAAVFYLLAEEFDRDPFMIFHLRGRGKDEVIAALRERRSAGAQEGTQGDETASVSAGFQGDLSPLESCMDAFWFLGPEMASFRVTLAQPPVSEAILKRLGTPRFWKSKQDFVHCMSPCYAAISRWAVEKALA